MATFFKKFQYPRKWPLQLQITINMHTHLTTRDNLYMNLIFIYIINYIYKYPLAELNQRMLNPSYRFPIY